MAIRVIARIRPQHEKELDKEIIVSAIGNSSDSIHPTEITLPNPRNEKEIFTFQFSSVYDHSATQQQLFDNEG